MKYATHLMAVSILALMASNAAHAETTKDNNTMAREYRMSTDATAKGHVEADDTQLTRDVKKGLTKADNAMRDTADDIRAVFVDEKANTLSPRHISQNSTTHGLIGQPILNPEGKRIAKVEDIIVDKDGNASKVIVADGGLLGIGEKLAAFDYSRIARQTEDGKVVMNLSQEMIDEAVKFSYDRDDRAEAKVLPVGSVSAKELVDGNVYNSAGKKVASIENLTLMDGDADRLIVKFDETFGLGGELAALNYDSLNVTKKDGDLRVNLSQAQTRQFADFRQMVTK